ncbi:hypothetical protein SD37_04875 [Amycolatopsis orientalis]|uniref:Uncharacterized protein n=1 Tax=Amycolatopsis orientalis TaxID=31958 RepID=A0A193BS79_AMYOR|nr:hypothetical protein [Amycolatopsis orientalis]ANN15060.1 hypothetical protein SD37_04875 [Amycolatopsis orientalis]
MIFKGFRITFFEGHAVLLNHRSGVSDGPNPKAQVHRLPAKGSASERMREIQERKSLLFAEFARKSEAKEIAEQHRLSINS